MKVETKILLLCFLKKILRCNSVSYNLSQIKTIEKRYKNKHMQYV